MPEEKPNNIPVENPGRSDEVPAPEVELSNKLAEQADAVTSQLRDLLPESSAAAATTAAVASEIQEAQPVETSAEAMPPVDESHDVTSEPIEPAVAEGLPSALPAESAGGAASQPAVAAVPAAAGTQVEPNSDDRLMSALAWLTMVLLQLPIVSVIQLLSTTTKDRPFQRHHAVTSLLFYAAAIVYEFVAVIVYAILGALTLGCGYACLWVIFFLPHALGLYYALQAYNGKMLELPVLSNFGRQQGWL
jgi:uncharacterized membrane protein